MHIFGDRHLATHAATVLASRVGHGGTMRRRSALLTTGLAIAGVLLASTPALAAPLDKGHFHDVFTDTFTCDTTGTPVQEDDDISGNFLFNLRGSSAFPYDRESVH